MKKPKTSPGYRPDLRIGNTVVEVKSDLHSLRNLRSALLQLGYYVCDEAAARGVLVLVNPRITDAALQEEWQLLECALRPEVAKRLGLAVKRDAGIAPVAGHVAPGLARKLPDAVSAQPRARSYRAPQSPDAILLVLLNQWLLRKGPMTTQGLLQAVGCSYPTAANALRRLSHVVRRFSDRKLQLWGFPAEEWQRAVANREHAHPTIHYVDRSGQRRDAESLLRRLSKLDRNDMAVGGVIAARHYYPALDLRGTPRLDLTLHSPDGRADLSFVEQLDAALERTSAKGEPADVAVHVLRRKAPFFEDAGDGLPWADPVSVVLDLHDARLDLQAKELLDHLVTNVG